MDGEKDPRNLLVAFHIVHDLISRDYNLGISCSLELVGWGLSNERSLSQPHSFSVALGPFVEELFEVTSCYFPIDFTPVSSTFYLFVYSLIYLNIH